MQIGGKTYSCLGFLQPKLLDFQSLVQRGTWHYMFWFFHHCLSWWFHIWGKLGCSTCLCQFLLDTTSRKRRFSGQRITQSSLVFQSNCSSLNLLGSTSVELYNWREADFPEPDCLWLWTTTISPLIVECLLRGGLVTGWRWCCIFAASCAWKIDSANQPWRTVYEKNEVINNVDECER